MADALTAIGLSKRLGGRVVVDGVSFGIDAGEVVGLLGQNGAGKTTIFSMLFGLHSPDRGQVRLQGVDITGLPAFRRARLGIGYLPQQPSVFCGLTVRQNIRVALELGGRRRAAAQIDECLTQFELRPLAAQRADTLSGGERRRLELCRLLATRPSWLLLDEPFKGLDGASVQALQHHVRQAAACGCGVLLTDHAVLEARACCDRVLILNDGRLLAAGSQLGAGSHPDDSAAASMEAAGVFEADLSSNLRSMTSPGADAQSSPKQSA